LPGCLRLQRLPKDRSLVAAKRNSSLASVCLELLTRLGVILLLHFARLEIALQLTYGCVQCVFLLLQISSDICSGIIFTTRPLAVPARSPKKARGTQHNTHNKDQI
jgi:hypothetical protein